MKDKTSTLNKKIKSYSALAGSLIAAGSSADAQVVYTNVNPDSTVNMSGFYNLDLNNDGITDFKLVQQSGTLYSFNYYAVGVNPEFSLNAVDTSGGGGTATAANAGFVVDGSLQWVDSTAIAGQFPPAAAALGVTVPTLGYNFGNFLGQTGKFLPLRFDVEGDTFYGWARLNVAADAKSFTIVDYAYNSFIAGYAITGATVGISESALNNLVNIYSFEKNINVKFDPSVTTEATTVKVTNVLGQEILNQAITSGETVLNMSAATTGVYLVTITQPSGSYTKRVHIK